MADEMLIRVRTQVNNQQVSQAIQKLNADLNKLRAQAQQRITPGMPAAGASIAGLTPGLRSIQTRAQRELSPHLTGQALQRQMAEVQRATGAAVRQFETMFGRRFPTERAGLSLPAGFEHAVPSKKEAADRQKAERAATRAAEREARNAKTSEEETAKRARAEARRANQAQRAADREQAQQRREQAVREQRRAAMAPAARVETRQLITGGRLGPGRLGGVDIAEQMRRQEMRALRAATAMGTPGAARAQVNRAYFEQLLGPRGAPTFTAVQREAGVARQVAQRTAVAKEVGYAERDVETQGALTKATAELAQLRQRRHVRERGAAERLMRADAALMDSTFDLATERRRTRLEQRRRTVAFAEAPPGRALLEEEEAARRQQAAQRREAYYGLRPEPGAAIAGREVGIAEAQLVDRMQRRAAVYERSTAGESMLVAEQAKERAYAARHQAAVNQHAQALLNASASVQERGTMWQRAQLAIGQRQGAAPRVATELPTMGQQMGQAMFTTGRYALSGALLYGLIQTLSEVGREIQEIDLAVGHLNSQFTALGQAEHVDAFTQDLLALARATGFAADEVIGIGAQMMGAFQDAERAVQETAGVVNASLLSGLATAELTDSLTAAAKSYGVTIDDINDKAVGLFERFGVSTSESIKAFGDLSSVAESAGLTLDEVAAVLGVIQQRSGRSAAAITEGLSRVLPAMQEDASSIIMLYESIPALRPGREEVAEAFGRGEAGDVLVQLTRDAARLNEAQIKEIASMLGGRREAQYLIPLLEGHQQFTEELDRTESDQGKAARRIEEISQRLTRVLARLQQEIVGIAYALAEAGLLDATVAVASAIGLLVAALGQLIRWFTQLDDLTGGVITKLLGVALALKGIQAAGVALGKSRALLSGLNAISTTVAAGQIPIAGVSGAAAPLAAAAATRGAGVGGLAAMSAAELAAIRAASAARTGATARAAFSPLALTTAQMMATLPLAQRGPGLGARAAGGAAGAALFPTARNLWMRRGGRAAAEAAQQVPGQLALDLGADVAGGAFGGRLRPGLGRAGARAGGILSRLGAIGTTGVGRGFMGRAATAGLGLGGAAGALAGAATLGTGLAATASLQWANRQYNRLQADQAAALAENEATVQRQTLRQLADLRQSGTMGTARSGWWSGLTGLAGTLNPARGAQLLGFVPPDEEFVRHQEAAGAFFTGNRTAAEITDEQLADMTVSTMNAAVEQGLVDASDDRIKELHRRVKEAEGRGLHGEVIALLNELDEDERSAIEELVRTGTVSSDIAEDQGERQFRKAEELQAAFAAGEIDYGTYTAGLRRMITAFKAGEQDPGVAENIKNLERELRAAEVARITNMLQIASTLGQAAGEEPTAQLARLRAALANPAIQADPAQRMQIANEAISTGQQVFQSAIANAANATEALAIAQQGAAMDPAALAAIREEVRRSGGNMANISTRYGVDEATLRQLYDQETQWLILQMQANEGQRLDPGEQADQARRIAELMYSRAQTDQQRAEAQIALDQALIQGEEAMAAGWDAYYNALAARTRNPEEQTRIAVEQAEAAYQRALATGDTTRINEASAALSQARFGQQDVQRAIRDAQAQLDITRATRDPVEANRLALAHAQARRDEALAEGRRADALGIETEIEQLRQEAVDLARARQDAEAQLAIVRAARNPVEANRLALVDARRRRRQAEQDGNDAVADSIKIEIEQLKQEAENLRREQQAANVRLEAVRNAGNGLKVANDRVADIYGRLLQAQREGNQIEAANLRAELIEAQRAAAEQAFNQAQAQLGLEEAQAQANGEIVRVAEYQVERARRYVEFLRSQGIVDERFTQAQTELLNARANLETTRREDRIADWEFLYDMERMTAAELVSQLEAELALVPETNKRVRQDLERRIKALRDEMSQEAAWNIGEITLPTLYEARRLGETRASGAGYNVPRTMSAATDNRVISIVNNNYNAQDYEGAIAAMSDAISAPPRVGTTTSLY